MPVMSRLSEQDQSEARRLQSRRVLLAFRRGSDHQSLENEPHPGRALIAGLVVAALATIIAGAVGLLRGSLPDGWDDEGNVVVDEESGIVYIVDSGALRPVANETSLRLAFPGGPPALVRVDRAAITSRPQGAVFGRADLPARPPRLLTEASRRLVTCVQGDQVLVIAGSEAPPGGEAAAVMIMGQKLFLSTGRQLHRLADFETASRLGYPRNQVIQVPAQLATWLPQGSAMSAIRLPPRRALPKGTPPWLQTGTRVTDGADWYVAVNRVLRPVRTQTTMQLVFGPRAPRPTKVKAAELRAQRKGAPLDVAGHPSRPPKLTNLSGQWPCVDDALRSVAKLPIAGLITSSVPPGSGQTVIWTPRERGTLVAASKQAATAPSADDPVILLTEGEAFPIESKTVLESLGYAGQSVTVAPQAWIDSLPLAKPLDQLN
jgi:Type VII secretion system ESX-1, transport TM domain B